MRRAIEIVREDWGYFLFPAIAIGGLVLASSGLQVWVSIVGLVLAVIGMGLTIFWRTPPTV